MRISDPPIAPLAEELARLLAHDVRTPLNAIRGFADLLLAGAGGPLSGAATGLLAEIGRASRSLEVSIRLAQELAESNCTMGGSGTAIELATMIKSCGFELAQGWPEGRSPVVAGSDQAWRGLLGTCRDHLMDDAAQSTPTARLEREPDARLALTLAASERSAERAVSTLRIRLIKLLADTLGISLASDPPHLPLRLRIARVPMLGR